MSTGFVVWFTGLSGSGKSTLAALLASELRTRGVHVELLDGDEVRTHLSKGLGFSREDRDTNIRRIGFVAKLIARSGGCAMTAAISPYRAIRDELRAQTPHFVEVYCKASIDALADRDPKGLYRKALAGEIKGFTGVDDPYEEPLSPEVVVQTDKESREESLAKILARLEELGHVPTGLEAAEVRRAPSGLVAPHGGELVSRWVHASRDAEQRERAEHLPHLRLDAHEARDLALLAGGAYAPLKGFMNEKDWRKVVRSGHLETGLFWPVPITLAVNEARAASITPGAHLALRNEEGVLLAILDVDDVYVPDKGLEAREVFGTEDRAHPGVARLFERGAVYVGGELHAFDAASAEPLSHPAECRAALTARGLHRVVALETAGPLLRTHEYLARVGLEGLDGLLVLVREDDPGPLRLAARRRATEVVLGRHFPNQRALSIVSSLPLKHAGARELLLRALVAKTYGASHVLLLPEENGVARESLLALLAATRAAELGFVALVYEEPFVSASLGEVATRRTAPDGAAGTPSRLDAVSHALARGEMVSAALVRPEVVAALRGT
jgi:3'-phosphoadenosine 5'-phosphosulfate synthase